MTELKEIQIYVVNGYQFETKEDYDNALQEKKGILYLNEQLNQNEPEKILQLYNELIDKRIFSSPVGIDYLKQLRTALLKSSAINNADVMPVYVPSSDNIHNTKTQQYIENRFENDIKNLEKKYEKTKNGKKTSIILNCVLIVVIIAMFVVASTTSNANIINYERVIQDKYASWAEELKKQDQEIKDKQRELQSIEESIEDIKNSQN